MVKIGSIWSYPDGRQFIVISTVSLDGHNWIHYRDHNPRNKVAESKEYSCYEESFVGRFSLVQA